MEEERQRQLAFDAMDEELEQGATAAKRGPRSGDRGTAPVRSDGLEQDFAVISILDVRSSERQGCLDTKDAAVAFHARQWLRLLRRSGKAEHEVVAAVKLLPVARLSADEEAELAGLINHDPTTPSSFHVFSFHAARLFPLVLVGDNEMSRWWLAQFSSSMPGGGRSERSPTDSAVGLSGGLHLKKQACCAAGGQHRDSIAEQQAQTVAKDTAVGALISGKRIETTVKHNIMSHNCGVHVRVEAMLADAPYLLEMGITPGDLDVLRQQRACHFDVTRGAADGERRVLAMSALLDFHAVDVSNEVERKIAFAFFKWETKWNEASLEFKLQSEYLNDLFPIVSLHIAMRHHQPDEGARDMAPDYEHGCTNCQGHTTCRCGDQIAWYPALKLMLQRTYCRPGWQYQSSQLLFSTEVAALLGHKSDAVYRIHARLLRTLHSEIHPAQDPQLAARLAPTITRYAALLLTLLCALRAQVHPWAGSAQCDVPTALASRRTPLTSSTASAR